MEAMVCGMPVITTDGQPWDELPAIARIPAAKTRKKYRREHDFYVLDPAAIVDTCKQVLGKDITTESLRAREWAEGRDFRVHASELERLVIGG